MTNLKVHKSRGQALSERALLMLLLVVLTVSSLAFFGASATGIFNGINNAINGTTNTSPSPTSGPGPTGGTNGTLIISDSAPTLGQTITLTGSGFEPLTPVRAVLHSNPITLKTQNSDANGNITMEVYIPPTIILGDHLITLEGTNPSHTPITLTSPPLTIGPNPIIGAAQIASGPFFSGNYHSVLYSFSASVSGGVGDLAYNWTGPDGFTSTSAAPSYTFTCSALVGSVNLSVIDGARHELRVGIPLSPCPEQISASASISAGPTYGDNYSTATYTLNSVASGGLSPLIGGWTGPGGWTSADAAPTATFDCLALTGNVTYAVTDANGQTGHAILSLAACTSAMSVTPQLGTITYGGNYQTMTTTLTAAISGGQNPYTYAWTGPGSFTSTEATPSFTVDCLALPGTLHLTITDTAGKTASGSLDLTSCTSALTGSPQIVSGPLYSGNYSTATYNFALSAGGGVGALTYAWTGPDGFSSTSDTPYYTFACTALAGTISLTTTDTAGKTNTDQLQIPACIHSLSVTPRADSQTYTNNYTTTTIALAASIAGGQAPFTYTWSGPAGFNSSSATPSLTANCIALPQTISLTINDANSQSQSATLDLPACAGNLSVSTTLTGVTYNGNYVSKSGTLASTVSGGTAPFTYAWTGPGSYTSSIANPGTVTFTCASLSGSATLTVTDANSQSGSSSVTIPACPGSLGVNASISSGPLYAGNYSTAAYMFDASVSGGAGSPTYVWSGPDGFGSTDAAASYTFTCTALGGTVTLTVTDDNSKTATDTITLPACASVLTVVASANSRSYSSDYANTTFNLSALVSGGQAPYTTYSWSGPSGSTFSPSSSDSAPSITIPCSSLSSGGNITLNVSDAGGQVGGDAVSVTACPASINANITKTSGPLYSGNYSTVAYGFNGGASGGTSPYTYAWSGPSGFSAASQNASYTFACSDLTAGGTVTLTVTDHNTKTSTTTYSLSACAGALTAAIGHGTQTYTNNYTSTTLALTSTVGNGRTPYSYSWTGPGGFTSSSANTSITVNCSLLPAAVNLSVNDFNGQSQTTSYTIPACTGNLAVSASLASVTYNGNYTSKSGSLSSTVSGGTGPFTYAWTGPGSYTSSVANPGAVTFACTSLPSNATLTVTDANNQSGSGSVNIPVCPSALGANATVTSGPLYAGNYATAAYIFNGTTSGGSGTPAYAWSGPDGFSSTVAAPSYTFTCTALGGTVSLTVTDANGINATSTLSLTACNAVLAASTPTITNQTYASNYNSTTINLSSTVSGGDTPTQTWLTTAAGGTISWSGQTTTTPSVTIPCTDLTSGTQTVKIRVNDPTGQTIDSATLTIAACPSSMSLAPYAGTPTYSGNYITKNVTLVSGLTGGSAAYTYTWTGTGGLAAFSSSVATPALAATCSTLPATVNLTVTDGNFQSVSSSVLITACTGTIVSNPAISSGPAYSGNYATALYSFNANSSGGAGSLTYAWGGPDGFSSTTANPSYTFTCSALSGTITLTVTDPASKSVTNTINLPACTGSLVTSASPGTRTYDTGYAHTTIPLTSTVSGGQTAYIYGWTGPTGSSFSPSNSSTTPTVTIPCSSLSAGGSVVLNVTDANGQVGTATVGVTACPSQIFSTITKNSGPLYGGNYGTAAYTFTASALGGTNSYTYAWTGPSGFTSTATQPSYTFTCSDLISGNQVVTLVATDTNAKTGATTFTLAACTTALSVSASAGARTYASNYTTTSLALSSTVGGGLAGYTYAWTGPTGATFAPTAADTVPTMTVNCAALPANATLTITDVNGQVKAGSVSITACIGALTSTASYTGVTYNGNYLSKTGTLASTNSGGVTPYTYAWTGPGAFSATVANPGATTFLCSNLPGTAILTITDANLQTTTGSVAIPTCTAGVNASASIGSGPLYADNYTTAAYTFNSTNSGGSGALTLAWTGPSGFTSTLAGPSYTFDCTALAVSGTVTLTVTDAAGKQGTSTVNLPACPTALSFSAGPTAGTQTYVGNYTSTNVPLSATAANGYGTVTYAWSGGPTGASFSPQASATTLSVNCPATAGIVTVTATDGHGQIKTATLANVGACPGAFSAAISYLTVGFNGNYLAKNVTLFTTLYGGAAASTYAWTGTGGLAAFSSSAASPAASITCAAFPATANVTVTDINNQTASASVSVSGCPSGLSATASISGNPQYSDNYTTVVYNFTSSVSGGSPPRTLAWTGPSGFTSTVATPSYTFNCADLTSGGTVTLTLTDNNSKTYPATVSLPACPLALSFSAGPTAGTQTYSGNYTSTSVPLSATAANGYGTITYAWSGGPTGAVFSPQTSATNLSVNCPATAGTVTVTATDGHGQFKTATLASIGACAGAISATTSFTSPTYNGNYVSQTGTLASTHSGGASPYTYSWTGPGSFTSTLANPGSTTFICSSSAGTATLTVTDANLQIVSSSVTIPACPTGLAATAAISGSPLYSGNYTTVGYTFTSSASGGSTPLTLAWTGPSGFTSTVAGPSYTFNCADLTSGGTATLTVTDHNGKTYPTTVSLPACPSAITATVNGGTQTYGSNYTTTTIALSATVANGISPYTYGWTGPTGASFSLSASSTTPSMTVNCAVLPGTITLNLSDFNGNNKTATLALSACAGALSATTSFTSPTYNGNYVSQTGTLGSTKSGGVGPFTYSWTGPDSYSSTLANPGSTTFTCLTSAGTATLTVTDANLQTTSSSATIPACSTQISVGTPTISSGPSYTGNYSTVTYTFASIVSGGSTPPALTYLWTAPDGSTSTSTSPSMMINCAGWTGNNITLTVTDHNGANATSALTLSACPLALSFSAGPTAGSQTYVGNYASTNVPLSATAANGYGTITYAWSGGPTGASFSPQTSATTLSVNCPATAGTVTVTATDGHGQIQTATLASVGACPSGLSTAINLGTQTYTAGSSYTNTTVALTATNTGGQSGYTYAWTTTATGGGSWVSSNASATPSLTVACTGTSSPGNINLTVTDTNLKTALATAVVIPACPPQVSVATPTISAGPLYGGNYATVTYTFASIVSGGTGTLTYLWTAPDGSTSTSTSPSMMINCAGWTGSNISLKVTDALGKNTTASLALDACPSTMTAVTPTITSQTYSPDYNTTTLVLAASVSGGSGSYTYSWLTTATGGTLTWTNDTTTTPTIVLPSLDLKTGTQTFTIHVVDSHGVIIDVSVTIPAPPSAC